MKQQNKGGGGARLFDHVGFIIAYENGIATEEEIITGFTSLINSGLINGLQGHYQRTAAALVAAKYITPNKGVK